MEEQEDTWLPDVIDSWTFDDHADIFTMMMDEEESIDAGCSTGFLALDPPPTTPRQDACQQHAEKGVDFLLNCNRSTSPAEQHASKLHEKGETVEKENEQFILRPFQLWRILLIDPHIRDEKKAVKALQQAVSPLSGKGLFSFDVCTDALEALETIQRTEYQIVIVSSVLDYPDPKTLLDLLKQTGQADNLKVYLALQKDENQEDIASETLSDFDGHMRKPYTSRRLCSLFFRMLKIPMLENDESTVEEEATPTRQPIYPIHFAHMPLNGNNSASKLPVFGLPVKGGLPVSISQYSYHWPFIPIGATPSDKRTPPKEPKGTNTKSYCSIAPAEEKTRDE